MEPGLSTPDGHSQVRPFGGRGAPSLVVEVNVARGCASGDPLDGTRDLLGQISAKRRRGVEIVVVATGAREVGQSMLGITLHSATAAAGQMAIARYFDGAFAEHGVVCAQVLLTITDLRVPWRRCSLFRSLGTLLRLGTIPVVSVNHTMEDPGAPSLELTSEVAKLLASPYSST